MTANITWTLGPTYAVARCTRCGSDADAKDVATGVCWVCGYMGAVEFKPEEPR